MALVFVAGCGHVEGDESADGQEALRNATIAGRTEFPSTVILFAKKQFGSQTCTAARVGERHLITAAHCLDGDVLRLEFRRNGRGLSTPIGQVQAILPNETLAACADTCDSSVRNVYPDIALIRWKSGDTFPSEIPITPIDVQPLAVGLDVHLNGYGCTEYGESPDGNLRHGPNRVFGFAPEIFDPRSPIRSSPDLLDRWRNTVFLTSSTSDTLASTCSGDSGGPVYRADKQAIVGVTVGRFPADPSVVGSKFVSNFVRLDNEGTFKIGAWLERLGVAITRP